MNGFEAAARCGCLAAAAVLLVAAAAFRAGRRRGTLEGIRLGAAEALIVARQRVLESGFCPLCSSWSAAPGMAAGIDAAPPGDAIAGSLGGPRRAYPLTGGPP